MHQIIKSKLLFVKKVLTGHHVAIQSLKGYLVFNETFKQDEMGGKNSMIKKDYGFRGFFVSKNEQFIVSGEMNYFASSNGVSKTISMTLYDMQNQKTEVIGLKQYPKTKNYVGTCYTENKDYYYQLADLEIIKEESEILRATKQLENMESTLTPELKQNYNLKNNFQK